MKNKAGFTLLELMVVVAIISILLAVAIPAYTDYVIRARIPDATSTLAGKKVQMEQWFQDNRFYDNNGAALPANHPCTESTAGAFTINCSVLTSSTFTLQATGTANGPMTGFTYTIDQANAKTSAITRSGWSNPSPNTCWARTKTGSC